MDQPAVTWRLVLKVNRENTNVNATGHSIAVTELIVMVSEINKINIIRTYIDVNECLEGAHNCHKYADCTNTQGGFICKCRPGYEGTGTECKGQLIYYKG